MDAPKADFFWAIVGDAKPEPVAVVIENGRRVAYTCGCADPFDVDGADSKIVLIPSGWGPSIIGPLPMTVPPTPVERAEAARDREARIKRDRQRGFEHGHRRFNP